MVGMITCKDNSLIWHSKKLWSVNTGTGIKFHHWHRMSDMEILQNQDNRTWLYIDVFSECAYICYTVIHIRKNHNIKPLLYCRKRAWYTKVYPLRVPALDGQTCCAQDHVLAGCILHIILKKISRGTLQLASRPLQFQRHTYNAYEGITR